MTGKQIFFALLALIIIIRDPQIVTTIVNGILNLFQVNPHG